MRKGQLKGGVTILWVAILIEKGGVDCFLQSSLLVLINHKFSQIDASADV